ncbi:porin [Vibrio mexicanus]|uniref:porin n=1 Tax=Vibrio mexicanus TaxID=1004326 RepID=UPI00063CBF19|nr:porin [Vibrio mexicanus]
MNKAAIATAVFSALVSGSSLAATVYDNDGTELKVGGRVEFRGDFIGSSGAEVDGTMKDKSRARLNLKGSTEIADGLKGFAFYEAEQGSGDSEFDNRYMYAGLDTNIGAFSAGRQDMAAVIISDLTDVTEFSGIQQYIDSASDKEDSTFAYRGSFDALQVEATYTANSTKSTDGYSISGLYSLPMGLDLGLAYSGADLGQDAGSESQFLLGAGFTWEALYLGATYSMGDINDKAKEEFNALEVVAAYKITDQFTLKALYANAEVEDKSANTKADSDDFFEVVGYYKFNGNISSYVSYMSNGLTDVKDANGVVTAGEDTLRLGLKYKF